MAEDYVKDEETLYRVVRKSNPDSFINGKPTAALFMDNRGLSVDRDGGRSDTEITEELKKRFNHKNDDYGATVKIGAGQCRQIGTFPIPKPNKKNIHHAEIHESETKIEISLLKAIQLARLCEVI